MVQKVKKIELEVLIINKIILYTIVDRSSSLNIMPIQTMKKLDLNITVPSSYVINMVNQSQDTPLDQIKGCRIITSSKKYFLTFHIIHMDLSRNSYLLLLDRPWLKATKAKIDWGGKKISHHL